MIGGDGDGYNYPVEKIEVPTICGSLFCNEKVTHVVVFTNDQLFRCRQHLQCFSGLKVITIEEFKKR